MKTLYKYKMNDFVTSKADEQNAVDLFKGDWVSALPGVTAGGMGLFDKDNDIRPRFVTDRFGSIKGWNVLELGSFEGGHTYQLEKAGANVVAIEANPHIFVRSLIAKNVYNLNAKFLLGDFTQYLDGNANYDMIFCSGVLYHMPDPIDLIKRMAAQTARVFIWTHYVAEPKQAEEWKAKSAHTVDGFACTYYKYVYPTKAKFRPFAGVQHYASRLTRSDILAALRHFGFTEIEIARDEPEHPGGPAFSITAAKA